MVTVKQIDSFGFAQWQKTGRSVRLIDVRSLSETARGVIKGAEWLPLHLLPMNVDLLAQSTTRSESIVLYCRSGVLSYQACAFLMQRGLGNVYNLQGGILGWMSSGRTLVSLETDLPFAS